MNSDVTAQLNVSEFLQFIGITVFFYDHFLDGTYGMMEYCLTGLSMAI